METIYVSDALTDIGHVVLGRTHTCASVNKDNDRWERDKSVIGGEYDYTVL